ncbi:hypothetical protein QAD02_007834 [Eretmocerus hayati]|uniref:Uncharacterized protein n=1 Tax=Eretmocerus hayati TaxID=131215 RepID=A0ACC2N525_9HYME|nr:hypothetical protein QAD02_007834 [Eretmocerus hayati]
MDTLRIFKKLKFVEARSEGVYAADDIQGHMIPPTAIVRNTDERSKQGTHWVAIYIDINNVGIFFDIYGRPLTSPYHLKYIGHLAIPLIEAVIYSKLNILRDLFTKSAIVCNLDILVVLITHDFTIHIEYLDELKRHPK